MKKMLLTVLSCLIMICLAQQASAAKQELTFGVHPFKSQAKLQKMFIPLIKYLEQELNAKITFKRSKSYGAAQKALTQGETDISYLGPALFALLDTAHPGQIRICATVENNGKNTFKGVIVAKKDSGINSLDDLKGKRFAFGDRKSTLSLYMPAHMLMEAGVFDSIDYDFFGTHDKVAVAVLRDKADAGGLKPDVAAKFLDKGLVIIAESQPVHEHMIVVGSNVDDALYDRISAALLKLSNPAVYTPIKKSLTGFVAAKAADYDNLKGIIKTVDAKMDK